MRKPSLKDMIGKRLRERREALGLSQEEVAGRILGNRSIASAPTLSHYECGRRVPNAVAIRDLAQALECSADYILGLSEKTSER